MTAKNSEKCVNEAESMSAEQIKYGYNPMEHGVRWTEKYGRDIEKFWKLMPNWLGQVLATIAVFLLASGLHGMEWIEDFRRSKECSKFICCPLKLHRFKSDGTLEVLENSEMCMRDKQIVYF